MQSKLVVADGSARAPCRRVFLPVQWLLCLGARLSVVLNGSLAKPPKKSLGRSVVFSLAHNSQPAIEALLPSGRRPRAEDAKLRDRSAPDVCPIAILRGLLL